MILVMDHDVDIKPIAKEEKFFMHWVVNYPFYRNIQQEGVVLYDAALRKWYNNRFGAVSFVLSRRRFESGSDFIRSGRIQGRE